MPAGSCPFGFAGEGVTDAVADDVDMLTTESEGIEDVREASWELEELDLVEVESRAEVDDDNIERLELDKEDVDSVDSVGVVVFVVDSVVGPTGIMVRTSGIEDELEVSEV